MVNDIMPREFTQDFRLVTDEALFGEYLPASKKSYIYLKPQFTVDGIIDSCTHETLHHCISEVESEGDIKIDIQDEHRIIHIISWIDEYV